MRELFNSSRIIIITRLPKCRRYTRPSGRLSSVREKFIIVDIYLKFNTQFDRLDAGREETLRISSGEDCWIKQPTRVSKQSFALSEARASIFPGGDVIPQSSDVSTIFPRLSTSRTYSSPRLLSGVFRRILRRKNRDAKDDDIVTSHGKLFMIPDARVCSRYH